MTVKEINSVPAKPGQLCNCRICVLLHFLQEDVPAAQTPLLQPDSVSLHSDFSLDVDQMKGKNEERVRRLTELQQRSAHLGMLVC